MFENISKYRNKIVVIIVILSFVVIYTQKLDFLNKNETVIGASIHAKKERGYEKERTEPNNDKYYEIDERFQRPSKLPSVKLKYNFLRPKDYDEVPPYVAEGFPLIYDSSEDVIHGYYAILKSAANMSGYEGGCGSIIWGRAIPLCL